MAQKDTKIAVLGDGGWGTTLSLLLASKGYPVILWGAFPKYVEEISKKRENLKFLPGFRIPERVQPVSDIHGACAEAGIIVLAAPSQYMRGVLAKIKRDRLRQKLFVNVAKGVETRTLEVMSEVVREMLGPVGYCTLSGPTIAREVALKMPGAAVVASKNKRLASRVRKIFSTEYFALYESDDVLGVELGGSVKNVIAIAAGIAQGLGYGSNMRAALFARGVAEMARLGHAMGARRETFMGLSGLGDLATTCLSPHSRNRSFGEELGKGKKLESLLKSTEMVVEGVDTTRSAYCLARKHKVPMPIVDAVHKILFENKKPKEALNRLIGKGPSWESD